MENKEYYRKLKSINESRILKYNQFLNKEINELVKVPEIVTHDPILEMARINDPKEFPFDVFVYGGDSYGSGRNEHGEPHFHFADKIKGGNWQFSILIPTVEQWKQSKELYIYETSNGDYNWTGLKKQKKLLTDWLNNKNRIFSDMTNIEYIRLQWNGLNIDNKNVSQIKKIK